MMIYILWSHFIDEETEPQRNEVLSFGWYNQEGIRNRIRAHIYLTPTSLAPKGYVQVTQRKQVKLFISLHVPLKQTDVINICK